MPKVYFIAIALLLANPFYNIIAENKPSMNESQKAQEQNPQEKKIEEYRQKLASNPNDIELHRSYQNLMRELGKMEDVSEEYILKLTAEPQNPLYFYLYGRLLEGKELEDSFKRALDLEAKTPNPELRFWLYFGLGQFYLDTKKYKEALQYLEMASKLKTASLDVRHQMALVYYEMDNIAEAMNIWDKILQVKNDYLDAMLGKALIYKSRGMYDNAIKELENILKVDVAFWRAYEPLIQCYHAKQDYQKAAEIVVRFKNEYSKQRDDKKGCEYIVIDIINLDKKVLIVKDLLWTSPQSDIPWEYYFEFYTKGKIDKEPNTVYAVNIELTDKTYQIILNKNGKPTAEGFRKESMPNYQELLNLIKSLEK